MTPTNPCWSNVTCKGNPETDDGKSTCDKYGKGLAGEDTCGKMDWYKKVPSQRIESISLGPHLLMGTHCMNISKAMYATAVHWTPLYGANWGLPWWVLAITTWVGAILTKWNQNIFRCPQQRKLLKRIDCCPFDSGGMNYQHKFCWASHSIPGKFPHFVVLVISLSFSCWNSRHLRKPKHLESMNQTVSSRVSGSGDPKALVSYSFSSSAAVRKPAQLVMFPFPCDLRSFLLAWMTFIIIFRLSMFAPISMWLFTNEKYELKSARFIFLARWLTNVRKPQGQQAKTLSRYIFKWSHFSFLAWEMLTKMVIAYLLNVEKLKFCTNKLKLDFKLLLKTILFYARIPPEKSTSEIATDLAKTKSLETKYHQFDNFVVTGGTVSCHNDNLQCHQSQQSCQIDNLLFSVM